MTKKEKTENENILKKLLVGIGQGDETETALKKKLRKDMIDSASMLTRDQARYLIDTYYRLQDFRIQSANQVRALDTDGKPSDLVQYFTSNFQLLEDQIKFLMGAFAKQYSVGSWLQSICGIGPVLSAAFLVTFSPLHRRTAGAWYAHAGIAPGIEWNKGEKRPFNARAKVFCFKAGESFVKVQNNDSDFYGKLYRTQKDFYLKKNAEGGFKDNAAAKLDKYKIGKTTDAYASYSTGALPPAHIHSMARRYAVKIFLSHLHDVAWEDYYGEKAPCPYVFSDKFTGGVHRHFIEVPNRDALKGRPLIELFGTEAEDIARKEAKILASKNKKEIPETIYDD